MDLNPWISNEFAFWFPALCYSQACCLPLLLSLFLCFLQVNITWEEQNRWYPLINISKQFYVFPCDESLEPFLSNYLNVIIASAILCFLWLAGCTETAAMEWSYRTAPKSIVQSSWRRGGRTASESDSQILRWQDADLSPTLWVLLKLGFSFHCNCPVLQVLCSNVCKNSWRKTKYNFSTAYSRFYWEEMKSN